MPERWGSTQMLPSNQGPLGTPDTTRRQRFAQVTSCASTTHRQQEPESPVATSSLQLAQGVVQWKRPPGSKIWAVPIFFPVTEPLPIAVVLRGCGVPRNSNRLGCGVQDLINSALLHSWGK